MSELLQRLKKEVHSLASPSGRAVGTAGHEQARKYLESRLTEFELDPYQGASYSLGYRARGADFANLIAVASGTNRDLAPILLGAHYDTAGPFPGADDNAAAVAIALALAERFKKTAPKRNIVFAFFDAEEPPNYLTDAMGSIRFFRDQRRSDFHAALILDLVGHDVPLPGLEDLLFVTGMESSPCLEPCIKSAALASELKVIAALNRYVGDVSDHHAFRTGGTPYLFFSCGRWEHYHQPSDTPEKLNYSKMAAQVDLLEGLITDLAERDECLREDYNTTATDLALMKKHLGELARNMNIPLESREDIDLFAARLNSLLGI